MDWKSSRYIKEAQRTNNESRQAKKRNTLMNIMNANSNNTESMTQEIYQRIKKERQRLESSVKLVPMASEDFDADGSRSIVKSVREDKGLLKNETD